MHICDCKAVLDHISTLTACGFSEQVWIFESDHQILLFSQPNDKEKAVWQYEISAHILFEIIFTPGVLLLPYINSTIYLPLQ